AATHSSVDISPSSSSRKLPSSSNSARSARKSVIMRPSRQSAHRALSCPVNPLDRRPESDQPGRQTRPEPDDLLPAGFLDHLKPEFDHVPLRRIPVSLNENRR